jgi:hypothetical protein
MRLSALATPLIIAALGTHALAAERCGTPSSLLASRFEVGEQPSSVTLPPDATPLSVTIASPSNNSTVGVSAIIAYGTYTGPANSGIVAADVPALIDGNAFVSPRIRLSPGANTIQFRFGTLDGVTTTVSRVVNYDPAMAPAVSIQAAGPGDYAPVRMPFSLSTRFPAGQNQITRVQVDYQDDGSFEVDASQPVKLEHAYSVAGFFTVRARVTFDDGDNGTGPIIVDDTTRVLIQSLAFTRETLCRVYYGMKHRLQAGNIPQALNTLAPSLRPRFEQFWGQLQQSNLLSTVAGRLGEIADGQLTRSTAELIVAMPGNTSGQFNAYRLVFRKDKDGVWRIAIM